MRLRRRRAQKVEMPLRCENDAGESLENAVAILHLECHLAHWKLKLTRVYSARMCLLNLLNYKFALPKKIRNRFVFSTTTA